jgi:large subunit ribosomal protein L9
MEVILTKDVDRLGREGEVVDVSAGYARNFLFRRKLAIVVTKGALKDVELRRGAIDRRQAKKMEDAQAVADQLKDITIRITRKAGGDGRIHGSVTNQDIAQAVFEETEMELDRRRIELPQPIRSIGAHLVTVRIAHQVEVELPVDVVPESEPKSALDVEEEPEPEAEEEPEPEAEEEPEPEAEEEPEPEAEEEPEPETEE